MQGKRALGQAQKFGGRSGGLTEHLADLVTPPARTPLCSFTASTLDSIGTTDKLGPIRTRAACRWLRSNGIWYWPCKQRPCRAKPRQWVKRGSFELERLGNIECCRNICQPPPIGTANTEYWAYLASFHSYYNLIPWIRFTIQIIPIAIENLRHLAPPIGGC